MRRRLSRGLMTALFFCAVLSAFYLRTENTRPVSAIPVERVFARVAVTQAPVGEKQRRDDRRSQEMAALSALAGQDAAAADALRALVERAENEMAVEDALSAMGHAGAMCSLRPGAAAVCVKDKLKADQAQKIIELCAQIAQIDAEKVFILDECAYL
ncbi:MAG: SpoIIIAH-like family protein [Clostridia bacterium]|nr:SpoIIIAH-like family protein [Clostridia bacterium]